MKSEKRSFSVVDVIINKRMLIEKIFGLAVILSIICIPLVGVNYDLSEYLPSYAPSKEGLLLMQQEFGYPGTARIMVGKVSLYEAKIYKDRIENVDGVDMVMWADKKTNIYKSGSFIDYNDIDDYYKDGYSVMDVTFDEGDSSPKTHAAIDEIEKITGDKGYFTGSSVQNKSLDETLSREMSMIMVIGVIMIAIVLCITTTSWFEPVMFLMIMGIAIAINMGTNIFLGTISFLTFSVAAILQLAIAIDFSVFLLHAFTRERQAGVEPTQAVANAIRGSATSILSGGCATFVGFIVLTLMRFSIGRDMGIVLAKGIAISIVTVLFLMPALILRWSDRVEKTKHRPFTPSFNKLGEKVFKIRYVVFALVVFLVIPSSVAKNMNDFSYGNSALGSSPGTKVYDDEQKINARFGRSNLILAIIPNTSNVTEKELTNKIKDLNYTKSATSLADILPDGVPESIVPKNLSSKLHTKKYSRMMIYIKTSDESSLAFKCTDEIRSIVKKYYPEDSYLVGLTPSTQDIKGIITVDYNYVDAISLLGVALAVLITFRSGIIPIMVIIPIEVAIFFNMALPYLMGDKMIYMGYIIVSCLQLGATVDYSILMTNNYLDNRTSMGKKEAAIEAISQSTLPILTSGSILTIVGYALYFSSSVSAIASMGRLVGRGALLSVIMIICLLPVLLVMSDKIVFDQKERMSKIAKLRQARMKEVRLSRAYKRKLRKKRLKRAMRRRRREAKYVLRKAKKDAIKVAQQSPLFAQLQSNNKPDEKTEKSALPKPVIPSETDEPNKEESTDENKE